MAKHGTDATQRRGNEESPVLVLDCQDLDVQNDVTEDAFISCAKHALRAGRRVLLLNSEPLLEVNGDFESAMLRIFKSETMKVEWQGEKVSKPFYTVRCLIKIQTHF